LTRICVWGWGLSYDTQLYIFRIGICVVPLLLFVITRRVCRERLAAERVEEDRHRAEQEAETHERSLAATRAGAAS
jgi:hypothetical protein